MKYKTILSKKDLLITIGCLVFVLLNIAAIGNTGRQKAKEIICLSNMKQWNSIVTAYTNDNYGFFPPDYKKNENGSIARCYWHIELLPYYKDKNLLLCPSAIKTANEGGVSPFCSSSVYVSPEGNSRISYCYNGWISTALEQLGPIYGRDLPLRWTNINTFVQPDTIPLITDSIGWLRKFPQADTTPPDYRNQPSASIDDRLKDLCIDRHGPAKDPYINSAFTDGSARNVGLKELWTLNWHRQWQQERQEYQPVMSWPEWMQDFTDYE